MKTHQGPHLNNKSNPAHTILLRVIEELVHELHAKRRVAHTVTLDSSLDHDLGLDSLARMELLARLEKQFATHLPEQLLATAETPRDLLQKLLHNSSESKRTSKGKDISVFTEETPPNITVPHHAGTLTEVLLFHADTHGDQVHICSDQPADTFEEITYGILLKKARQFGAGLQHYGLQPGDRVGIMLPTGADYFFSFLGILLAGGIPVPLYPPVRPTQIEEHLQRHRKILINAGVKILITIPEVKPLARLLRAQVQNLIHILDPTEASEHQEEFIEIPIHPNDIAFLQYTSGSTGDPKGVVLTHANLLANIRTMGRVIQVSVNDIFVSWLPLYHDMGLIGAWLGSLHYGCKLVIMAPLTFLARPERWLRAIDNHKGTLSASPNFGYELCCKRLDDASLEGLDLSSWRLAFNGAEPVSPETLTNFQKRFARYGFRKQSLAPVYGLAESSVGLAFPPQRRAPIIDHIQRKTFLRSGIATPVDQYKPNALKFVACGRPLPDHHIRIVDNNDRELPERHEGHLQFKGPSATSGYFKNSDQTRALFHGDWLDSGDLAYIAAGDLFITGRVKDIIIRGGRNIYPHEVEEAVGNIEGIRKGCVAVFGSQDKRSATEQVVILAESRARKEDTINRLHKAVSDICIDLLGTPPDEIILAPPGTVLKTSSGKIRRAASKEMYEKGQIGKPKRAIWLQITRMALRGVVPQSYRLLRQFGTSLYAVYCWLLFGLVSIPVGFSVTVIPSYPGRWWITRLGARLLAFLTATRIQASGLEHLLKSQPPFILAANHMSYLDSLVISAILPVQCSFVAKAELTKNPVVGMLLSRLDVFFVNRFDFEKGIEDAERIRRQVESGKNLFFFCEGTFQRIPGLLPFQLGAFTTAVRENVPVIPITINGTRNKMRGRTWFPRIGGIRVIISSPQMPKGNSWESAINLRDKVRDVILHHCGEPDLIDFYSSITQTEAGLQSND